MIFWRTSAVFPPAVAVVCGRHCHVRPDAPSTRHACTPWLGLAEGRVCAEAPHATARCLAVPLTRSPRPRALSQVCSVWRRCIESSCWLCTRPPRGPRCRCGCDAPRTSRACLGRPNCARARDSAALPPELPRDGRRRSVPTLCRTGGRGRTGGRCARSRSPRFGRAGPSGISPVSATLARARGGRALLLRRLPA